MTLAWKQIRVYSRLGLVVVLALAVACVLWKNRSNEVSFWFFGLTEEAKAFNVCWLVLFSACATVVIWRVLAVARGLIRDFREVRRQKLLEKKVGEQDKREAELEHRERRIDEKVRRAIATENTDKIEEE